MEHPIFKCAWITTILCSYVATYVPTNICTHVRIYTVPVLHKRISIEVPPHKQVLQIDIESAGDMNYV